MFWPYFYLNYDSNQSRAKRAKEKMRKISVLGIKNRILSIKICFEAMVFSPSSGSNGDVR